MSLNEFLIWISNSGGNIMIVSWLMERWPWYQGQVSTNKQYIFFGASFVVSVLAYVVLNYVPANVLEMIAPYFLLLYGSFCTVFVGSAFHKLNKLNK